MKTQNKKFHHQKYSRNQNNDYHNSIIFLNFCDSLNKPFEKCQKKKFDDENCDSDKRKKNIKICV